MKIFRYFAVLLVALFTFNSAKADILDKFHLERFITVTHMSSSGFNLWVEVRSDWAHTLVVKRGVVDVMMHGEKVATNASAMVGKRGVVCQEVDEVSGRVMVEGVDWRANSEDGELLPIGTKVVVTAIDSVVLTVKKFSYESYIYRISDYRPHCGDICSQGLQDCSLLPSLWHTSFFSRGCTGLQISKRALCYCSL